MLRISWQRRLNLVCQGSDRDTSPDLGATPNTFPPLPTVITESSHTAAVASTTPLFPLLLLISRYPTTTPYFLISRPGFVLIPYDQSGFPTQQFGDVICRMAFPLCLWPHHSSQAVTHDRPWRETLQPTKSWPHQSANEAVPFCSSRSCHLFPFVSSHGSSHALLVPWPHPVLPL